VVEAYKYPLVRGDFGHSLYEKRGDGTLLCLGHSKAVSCSHGDAPVFWLPQILNYSLEGLKLRGA